MAGQYVLKAVIHNSLDDPKIDIICLNCHDSQGMPMCISSKVAYSIDELAPTLRRHHEKRHVPLTASAESK